MVGVHYRQRGFAAIVAICALALSSVTVLLVSTHLHRRLAELRLEERTITLSALSDASLAEALAGLAADPSWTGSEPRTFGAGTISSRVQQQAEQRALVTTEALFGAWRATIEAEVDLNPAGPRVVSWSRSQGPAS